MPTLSACFKSITKLLKGEVFDYFQHETQVIHDVIYDPHSKTNEFDSVAANLSNELFLYA